MAKTLEGLGVVKNVKYGYQEAYNQWSEIVDAVNQALKNQPLRGGNGF